MQSVPILLCATLLLIAQTPPAGGAPPQEKNPPPATNPPPAKPQADPQANPAQAKPPQQTTGSTMGADKPPAKQEELDQLLASIALYPDDLLSQVLMASTYPIEVVQAERWVKANSKLTGDALAKALEKQSWDASVKSLVNVPQVLTMMSEKLDWTVSVGNCFIGQQKEVMETVQKLRAKAKEAGNLASTKEQKVSTENQDGKEVIVIEQSSPEVIYVPTYNPAVIYGTWPYPAYPPYYWYPPAYVPPPYPAFHFGVGFAIGVAWGYAWGHCGWGSSDVDIDVNRNTNINRNIDRGKYAQQLDKRGGGQGGRGQFKHDPAHRGGVAYRDQKTAKQFGGASTADAAKARDSFRGRTDSGAAPKAGDRAGGSAGAGNRAGDRPSASQPKAGSGNRTSGSSGRSNAFDGASQGGRETRAASDRGRSSRSASSSAGARPRGGGGRRGR
jgi:uncharacterized protein DUF3300